MLIVSTWGGGTPVAIWIASGFSSATRFFNVPRRLLWILLNVCPGILNMHSFKSFEWWTILAMQQKSKTAFTFCLSELSLLPLWKGSCVWLMIPPKHNFIASLMKWFSIPHLKWGAIHAKRLYLAPVLPVVFPRSTDHQVQQNLDTIPQRALIWSISLYFQSLEEMQVVLLFLRLLVL